MILARMVSSEQADMSFTGINIVGSRVRELGSPPLSVINISQCR